MAILNNPDYFALKIYKKEPIFKFTREFVARSTSSLFKTAPAPFAGGIFNKPVYVEEVTYAHVTVKVFATMAKIKMATTQLKFEDQVCLCYKYSDLVNHISSRTAFLFCSPSPEIEPITDLQKQSMALNQTSNSYEFKKVTELQLCRSSQQVPMTKEEIEDFVKKIKDQIMALFPSIKQYKETIYISS